MLDQSPSIQRGLARLGLLGVLASCFAGCAENRSSAFIIGVMKPDESTCGFMPSGAATLYLSGALDVAFNYKYQAGLLVASQLIQRGDPDSLRTEVNRLALEGAEVELSDFDRVLDNGYFTVLAAGLVNPSAGTEPGRGVLSATLIPDIVGYDISRELETDGVGASKELTARVRVFGTTLGGVAVESGEFAFPITVCLGCLVSYPLEAIDEGPNGEPICRGNAESAPAPPCNPGQDASIDCRSCAAEIPLCESPF
jgi:hypothetical protein